MNFRIAFLNCDSLYGLGQHPSRGPQTQADFAAKVTGLSTALQNAKSHNRLDLIGLCELGSEAAGRAIKTEMQLPHDIIWEQPPPGPPNDPDTGMMILFDPRVLRRTAASVETGMPHNGSRYHWLAAEFQLVRGNGQGFWVVLNHWPSSYYAGQVTGNDLRVRTGQRVGEFYAKRASVTSDAMLLLGDFNCEPHEQPLTGTASSNTDRLVAVREHEWAINEKNRLPYFYNPMWRHLGEPAVYEVASKPGFNRAMLPPGTSRMSQSANNQWVTWDQLLVNKRLLTGGPATLVEKSIRIVPVPAAASDHCAIAASFRYS